MIRSLFRRKVALIGTLALLVAGPAFAFLQFLPQTTWQAGIPLSPPAAYNLQIVINPIAYGDQIVGIETGRDVRSPFAAITVAIGPTNPVVPIIQNQYSMNIPGFPGVSSPGFPLVTPYTLPPPLPSPFYLRLIYRPINDPVNPGWSPPLPGAVNQIEGAMQTCLAVANELTAFRTAAGVAPVGAPPAQLYVEVDPGPGATNMEFYTFQVIR